MRGRINHRERAGIAAGEDRRPLRGHRVEYRLKVIDLVFPGGQRIEGNGIRGAGAARIEKNEAAERG